MSVRVCFVACADSQEFEAEVWRAFDRNGRSFEYIIKLFREKGIFDTVPKFSYNFPEGRGGA